MSNETKIQKDKLCENLFAECNEDFILPDYMPEIRRVVRLESKLLPGENYMGGGKAEFEGSVLYTLFYTDTEETLTAVPLESRYEYRTPIGAEAPTHVYTNEVLESVNARPSGPRRINIRAKIRAAVHAVTEETVQENFDLLNAPTYEKLWRESEAVRSLRFCGEEFEVLAERMFESEGEEIRPIYGTAEILTESARAGEGHIRCQGTVLIQALAEKGGETLVLRERIPFEEEIIVPDCREDDRITAKGCCLRVELETEDDGERHLLHAKTYGKIEGCADRNEPFSVISDVYSTKENLEIAYKPFHAESLVTSHMGNFTVEADAPASIEGNVSLCSVSLRDASASVEDGKVFLSGECRAELLCRGEEGFFGTDFVFPFRTEVPLSILVPEDCTVLFSLAPLFAETAMQSDKCHLSFEMSTNIRIFTKKEFCIPDTLTAGGERQRWKEDAVVIYYPTDKDSLWSVGKDYGISAEELKKQNGILLSEDTALNDVKSLDGTAWLFVSRL